MEKALTALGRVVLWCLSVAGDNKRFETEIDQFVGELNALYAGPGELDALIAVLRYLVATHPRLGAVQIAKLLETTARKGQNKVNMELRGVRSCRRISGGRSGGLGLWGSCQDRSGTGRRASAKG